MTIISDHYERTVSVDLELVCAKHADGYNRQDECVEKGKFRRVIPSRQGCLGVS